MNEQRYLLIVSGPSGVGKDTVVNELARTHPKIELSVSATTRAPRENEKDGVNYHYLTGEEFEQKVQKGELLEHTCYGGCFYGTPKSEVDKRIAAGITCVLVIEVEGMANIKKQYPDSTAVFILPPSEEELVRRLKKRGSESEEEIERRIQRAREEMALADTYDYQLVNDDAGMCAINLYEILRERQAD